MGVRRIWGMRGPTSTGLPSGEEADTGWWESSQPCWNSKHLIGVPTTSILSGVGPKSVKSWSKVKKVDKNWVLIPETMHHQSSKQEHNNKQSQCISSTNCMLGILLGVPHTPSYLSLKMIQRDRPCDPHFLDGETETETVMPRAGREWNPHLILDLWSIGYQVMVVVVLQYENKWLFTQECKFLEVKEQVFSSTYHHHHLHQWLPMRNNFIFQR